MRKTWLVFGGITVLLVSTYFAREAIRERLLGLRSSLPSIDSLDDLLGSYKSEEPKKDVSVSSPLVAKRESSRSFLTAGGVFSFTNEERRKGGLPLLASDGELDRIAVLRMNDMFRGQYFAHYSPEGRGASHEADSVGYEYIAIGENIALGNFENDAVLVQAWMDSPGHRANILSGKYDALGVAVGKGKFEGKETWIGVQIFARPSSACPAPDGSIKERAAVLKAEIDALALDAERLKAELKATDPQTRDEAEAYNRKADEYNSIVRELNAKVEEVRRMIAEHNEQVRLFNECVSR